MDWTPEEIAREIVCRLLGSHKHFPDAEEIVADAIRAERGKRERNRTMAREFTALPHDEFRMMCPSCESMWSTHHAPSACLACGTMVTFRALRSRPKTDALPTTEEG